MSRKILRKESSYSEFRKQNSLGKFSLNNSVIDMDSSISIIADEKTSELLSMENQLQSLVRNRSHSVMPSAKIITHETLKLTIPIKLQTPDKTLQNLQKNSTPSNEQNQRPRTSRSTLFKSFTETFQVIEETQVQIEEDNFLVEDKQLNNKITSKTQNKNEKNLLQKRKDSFQIGKPIKPENKATIKDLEQMQKRLESVKKAKTFVGRDTQAKKTEVISKKTAINTGLNTQRRMQKTVSDAHLTAENGKLKGLDIMKQKQLAAKSKITKKVSLADSSKTTTENQGVLIPTKMVNLQQKQKLLKQFDKIKESIKHTDISADNIANIKSMLKTMQGFIN